MSSSTGIIEMKKIILLAIMLVGVAHAELDPTGTGEPQRTALKFNKWYISQVIKDAFPITDSHEIDKYVTTDTLKKLRHAQDPRYADDEFYDADFFLKAQDIADDWPQNIKIISSDYDPVCTQVYVLFNGKDWKHTVIDCMVKENGIWKVQSVANGDWK
jgi:hypothetical protein